MFPCLSGDLSPSLLPLPLLSIFPFLLPRNGLAGIRTKAGNGTRRRNRKGVDASGRLWLYRTPSGLEPASKPQVKTHQHFGGVVCRGYLWPALTADGVAFFVDRHMKTKRKKKAHSSKPVRIGTTEMQSLYGNQSPGYLLGLIQEFQQRITELKFLAACNGAPVYGVDEEDVVMVSYNEVWFPRPCDLAAN